MTAEKKLTVKRIIIFTILAYLPPYILIPLVGFSVEVSTPASFIGHMIIIFSPAVAHILTRLITKEGLTTEYLGLNLKGNIKYYAVAILLPVAVFIVNSVLLAYRYGENYRITDVVNGESWFYIVCVILQYIAMSVALFFMLMGEEYGWRAYLTPKLEEVMSEPAALIVSGIIWGMWHGPMVNRGLNFGMDYKFYPWLGHVFMCIFCICVGTFYTWLVKKTGSVHSASISHSVLDFLNTVIIAIFAADYLPESLMNDPDSYMKFSSALIMPLALISVFFMIPLVRKKRDVQRA